MESIEDLMDLEIVEEASTIDINGTPHKFSGKTVKVVQKNRGMQYTIPLYVQIGQGVRKFNTSSVGAAVQSWVDTLSKEYYPMIMYPDSRGIMLLVVSDDGKQRVLNIADPVPSNKGLFGWLK